MKRWIHATTETAEIGDDLLEYSKESRYQMLARLASDCRYFLGKGGCNKKVLWAGNVDDQIKIMKKLYNSFSGADKPDLWIDMDMIKDYEYRMKRAEEEQI